MRISRFIAAQLCLLLGACTTSPTVDHRVPTLDSATSGDDAGDQGTQSGWGSWGDDGDSAPETSTASATGAESETATTGATDDSPGSSSTGGEPQGPVVWSNNFNDEPVGQYTLATLQAGWNHPGWESGVSAGRVEVIDGPEAYDGQSLRVHYPAGAFNGSNSGAQWWVALPDEYEELWLSYRLRVDSNFEYVQGGKLPGLIGGNAPEGEVPDGSSGFSARGQWQTGGAAANHLYHMDQAGIWGDFFTWDLAPVPAYPRGQWVRVDHHVRMNTPGDSDGVLETWLDGEPALLVEDIRYRDTEDLAIDKLFFSTFFGGNAAVHAPFNDRTIDFDDFVISEEPIP